MNDVDIQAIYAEGCTQSHTVGLRAVFEAGRVEALVVAKVISKVAVKAKKPAKKAKKHA